VEGGPLITRQFFPSCGVGAIALLVLHLLVLAAFLRPVDLAAAPIVTLQAQVILASNQPGAAPDQRLAELIAQLRKALPYTSFQLLSARSGRTVLGKSWRTELPGGEAPGGRMLELTPTAIDRATIQVQARVVQAKVVQGKSVPETLVNTTLRLQSGGTVVIGGPSHLNGVLVIVISASIP